jgi:hypothetical protein
VEVAIPSSNTTRATAAGLAAGAVLGCTALALVDPSEPGRYPLCPTRALLGVDCPACGTLRGLHALLRGRPLDALGHNVLLAVAVPVGLVVWFGWLRAALGGPAQTWSVPRWALPTLAVVAVAFAVLRNVPIAPFSWLHSG